MYRTACVLVPSLSGQKAKDLIAEILEECGNVRVVNQKYDGVQNLSYPMKKHAQGHRILLDLEMEASKVKDLSRLFSVNDLVLRHMIIKILLKKESIDNRHDTIRHINDNMFLDSDLRINTTQRGRILDKMPILSKLPQYPVIKRYVSKAIKRARYIGVLPYCAID